MPVSQELLEILVCPETRQTVTTADEETLAAINSKVDTGALRNRGGDPVTTRVEEGLVREDRKILYVVDDSIPVMLIEESIELD